MGIRKILELESKSSLSEDEKRKLDLLIELEKRLEKRLENKTSSS